MAQGCAEHGADAYPYELQLQLLRTAGTAIHAGMPCGGYPGTSAYRGDAGAQPGPNTLEGAPAGAGVAGGRVAQQIAGTANMAGSLTGATAAEERSRGRSCGWSAPMGRLGRAIEMNSEEQSSIPDTGTWRPFEARKHPWAASAARRSRPQQRPRTNVRSSGLPREPE